MASVPRLTLPDGATVELPEGEPVGAVLPPDAVAARVDGELRDLSFVPAGDASVEPIAAGSDDALHVLRHSTAHVMAQAVCRLHPGAKYAIGPPIQDGFYYDFDLPAPIGEGDLPAIEAEMRQIVEEDQPFLREEVTREEAIARLEDQPFKREIVESIGSAEGEVAGGRGRVALPQRRVGGPVRGAPRPLDRPARRVHADLDRRRVLARRSRRTRC